MTDILKKEIEAFIEGWHCDEESYKYAFDMGKFFLSFTQYLHTLNMSERTRRKHEGNLELIGRFECNYGYHRQTI